MRKLTVAASVLVCWAALAAPAAAGEAPRETLILDESAYCRAYYEFALDRIPADLLKATGAEILGQRGLTRLRGLVRGLLKDKKIDWAKEDWRDRAVVSFYLNNSTGAGVDRYRGRYIVAPPPPADWTAVDFDDSVWPRLRRPLLVGEKGPAGWTDVSYLGVHRICWRSGFEIADPAGAGPLRFRLVFRGGARVLLNGTEIARAGLPAGEVGPETLAEPYALDAYAKRDGEIFAIERQQDERTRQRGKRKVYKYKFVPELGGRFEDGARLKGRDVGQGDVKGYVPDLRRFGGRASALMDRKTFHRIAAARDRTLDVAIGPERLRKGSNLLAVEIVAAPLHPATLVDWMRGLRGNFGWRHASIRRMSLRGPAGKVASSLERPEGVRVWTEDVHHRVYSSEFLPPGSRPGVVRIVGVRNATFSGQVVVGTSRPLAGLKATPADLTRPGGGVIPASAMRVGYLLARPLPELVPLDATRTTTRTRPLSQWERMAMVGYAPDEARALPLKDRLAALDRLRFFDHISASPPDRVAAGTCQPIWLSLAIPAGAAPGAYRGSVRVEADGLGPVSVPVEVEVIDWSAPPPRHFQTVSALEHSPYGVAKRYGTPLWSERHWERIEASLRLLARAGNDWWFVPCLNHTEFGNRADTMIRWVRRADGSIAFDYAILDRYLDLIVRHCGRPKVLTFVVMHGNPANPPEVTVYDERTGRPEPLSLGYPAAPYQQYRQRWADFATSLNAHMKNARFGAASGGPGVSLKPSMYWGYAWDTEGLPDLRVLLTEFVPDVYWSAGGHALRVDRQYYRATAQIFGRYTLVPKSQRGWKQAAVNVLNPRGGGNTHATAGGSLPFSYRLLADRAVAGGYRGFGRMGVDYWDGAYYDGTRGGAVFLQPGMSIHVLFWPGPGGADSSARYEMLLEGILEAEARIFLEQCIDRRALPAETAARFRDLLEEHTRATMYVSIQSRTQLDEYFPRWQERARRLFAAAAEAASIVGLDVDRREVAVDVPARGQARVELTLRDWTGRGRAWKAASDAAWLKPHSAAGTARGHQGLAVVLDAADLPADAEAKATLTLTDASTGRACPVAVTARVSKVLETVFPTRNRREFGFLPDRGKLAFDLAPGASASRSVVFFNHAGVAVPWKAASSAPWLKVHPAAGVAPPQSEFVLQLTAQPTGQPGIHQARLTVSEAQGPAAVTTEAVAYALGPYRRPKPAPPGPAVALTADLHKKLLKSRKERHPTWAGHEVLWVGQGDANPMPPDGVERGLKVTNALIVPAPSRTVYNIDGQGFRGFSVMVDFPQSSKGYKYWAGRGKYPDWVRLRFEVYADGRLRAHSGWMGPDDAPRPLRVDGLAGVKELALVTRHARIPPAACSTGWWNATFHK